MLVATSINYIQRIDGARKSRCSLSDAAYLSRAGGAEIPDARTRS